MVDTPVPPVELTRHGKPVAVVMGRETYDRFRDERQMFGQRFDRFRREWPSEPDEPAGQSAVDDPVAGIRSGDR